MDRNHIGDAIRSARLIQKGWSQKQLAEESGLVVDQIIRFEDGVHRPSIALLSQIADALEVDVFELLGER